MVDTLFILIDKACRTKLSVDLLCLLTSEKPFFVTAGPFFLLTGQIDVRRCPSDPDTLHLAAGREAAAEGTDPRGGLYFPGMARFHGSLYPVRAPVLEILCLRLSGIPVPDHHLGKGKRDDPVSGRRPERGLEGGTCVRTAGRRRSSVRRTFLWISAASFWV